MFTQKKTFNEQPASGKRLGYMAELDAWLDEAVYEPIVNAITAEDSKELMVAFSETKQLIKQKVLDSYHNGQQNPRTKES